MFFQIKIETFLGVIPAGSLSPGSKPKMKGKTHHGIGLVSESGSCTGVEAPEGKSVSISLSGAGRSDSRV